MIVIPLTRYSRKQARTKIHTSITTSIS